jgi:hypothetical protein
MSDTTRHGLSCSLSQVSSRRQALKLIGGGVVGGFVAAKGLTSATAQTGGGGLVFPVEFTSALGSFIGSFTVTRFITQGGQVLAVGTLTGTVRDAAGVVVGTINQALTLPLLGDSFGPCEILHLELGPLDLNLLGLVVHLDRIVLDITAEQGALLGDLLCAIANLLDGGSTNALTRLLNQVLRLLG